ncbi:MAG: arginine deiminase-related protein [Candidatus Poseidoniaceae archaeon]|nr:arginine deiminase-related protein [Candidatus Poseidoniaceae archaeon]
MATVRLDQKSRALVRNIPDSYSNAMANYFGTGPTDIGAARSQHAAYIEALTSNGVEVTIMDADNNHPDCVFVEDQAVVIDGHVLLPVAGHESRRGEQPPIAEFLSKALHGHHICKMELPAMMDGGDILRLGNLFFVGRSTRTNDSGINELRSLIEHLGHELRVVDIPNHALHLTSISSTPSDEIILAPEGYLTSESFGDLPDGCEVIMMPEGEVYGCNTIGLPGNKVIIAEGYPTVKSTLESRGFETIVLDMSQIRAADASPTCCSIFY